MFKDLFDLLLTRPSLAAACAIGALTLVGGMSATAQAELPKGTGTKIVPELPTLKPLFDMPLRDTSVCIGGDGMYYLTGTTGAPTWWTFNNGIRLWRSKDLKTWEPLGFVWQFGKDGTWQKGKDEEGRRALWAPEISYINGNYWIAYSMNYDVAGTGLLRSTTGKPEGPYEDVKKDGPLTSGIDSALFQDDDGKVYFVWQDGRIARMKDDMTGLAETPHILPPTNFIHVGFEAAFLFKHDGRYYLSCAEFNNRGGPRYDSMIASSDNIYGPYGPRSIAIPSGGHNTFFQDKKGDWWSTYFGNDDSAPFKEHAAVMRVKFLDDGRIAPMTDAEAAAAEKAAMDKPDVWKPDAKKAGMNQAATKPTDEKMTATDKPADKAADKAAAMPAPTAAPAQMK